MRGVDDFGAPAGELGGGAGERSGDRRLRVDDVEVTSADEAGENRDGGKVGAAERAAGHGDFVGGYAERREVVPERGVAVVLVSDARAGDVDFDAAGLEAGEEVEKVAFGAADGGFEDVENPHLAASASR